MGDRIHPGWTGSAEPTARVPIALIERVIALIDGGRQGADEARELRAILEMTEPEQADDPEEAE